MLAVAACWQGWNENLDVLLARIASHALPDLPAHGWYAPAPDECFPLEQDAMPIRLMANALKVEMQRMQTHCVHLGARVVCERQLNQLFQATRNKGNALFSISAIHLDHLLRTYGQRGLGHLLRPSRRPRTLWGVAPPDVRGLVAGSGRRKRLPQ